METPSSNQRVSQALAINSVAGTTNSIPPSSKDSEMSRSKQDRSALIDITNDSPIIGLAKNGNVVGTPVSGASKKTISRCKNTPGSGEALLRCQVKTLLQKVEEEEISKFSFLLESNNLKGFINNSPRGGLAAPANTPQILNFSDVGDDEELGTIVEDQLKFSQVVNDIFEGEHPSESGSAESGKNMITRSLLFDFIDKSESPADDSSSSGCCSSVLTYQVEANPEHNNQDMKSSTEDDDDDADDDSSIWSIQVNASSTQDKDDELIQEGEVEQVVQDNEESELLDELCDGMSNMYVGSGEKKVAAKFMGGKHTRFVCNSDDDEIVQVEEDDCDGAEDVDAGVLKAAYTERN